MAELTPIERLERHAERNAADMGSWERGAVAALRKALTANPDARGTALRQLIRAAYPFGERKYAPYKMWRRVVREALGLAELDRRRAREARDAAAGLFVGD